ncbi:OprD family outer membrane porin, partial [Pseudomonas syringae]|uniref:OprD family outer membrane porin n=1 Tax=Pseudomonas syringae TaxID=317 RepID=UPI0034D6E7A9
AFFSVFTARHGGHSFHAGYQGIYGDSPFPRVFANISPLGNEVPTYEFAYTDERSYQVRYDYNFAAIGIPGLTFMSRYVKGDHADAATHAGEGREWERNTDIAYVFQSGALKNVGIRWRNAAYRANLARGADENRLIVSYTLPIW